MNIGNTVISTVGGNLNVDVQTPDGFIYFIINGQNIASWTGRNTIVNYANLCGLDMQQNDLYNVNNAVIDNTIQGLNASFVNACFMNVRGVNLYCNPAVIDDCCSIQKCMHE